ncbi:MAG: hypothetical protein M1838_001313 [Thelocarpon superellum]|nr:MAG: hypothetical protein M1838_001313 [Thelocarpon superellum]
MSTEIPSFFGRKDGRESAKVHLETIEFIVEEKDYGSDQRSQLACRVHFRTSLRDSALSWYRELDEATKESWDRLKDAFVGEFSVKKNPLDVFTITNQIMMLRQGRKPITEYLSDADHLYKRCPEEMKQHIGRFLIGGLTDDHKIDFVQMYLPDLETVEYEDAKRAIIRAYSRIGRENPFDDWASKKAEATATNATATDASRELLNLIRTMAQQTSDKGQHAKPATENLREMVPPAFFPPPPPYQPSRRGQQAADEVVCHNCMGPGHFSTSCTAPPVTWKQKQQNRARIEQQ